MKLLGDKTRISAFLSIFILFLFAFSLSFPTLHSFTHSDEHNHRLIACTDDNEEDACHQIVFHLSSDHQCDHKGHLVESEEECELCASLVFSKTTSVNLNDSTVKIENHSSQSTSLLLGDISFYLFSQEVRGPPMVNTF